MFGFNHFNNANLSGHACIDDDNAFERTVKSIAYFLFLVGTSERRHYKKVKIPDVKHQGMATAIV